MAAKVVLITGTSTGIGAACTARLAGAGWTVYAGVRRGEDGERLAAQVDGHVIPVVLDVTRPEHVEAIVARIDDEAGAIDGLVNNAGIAVAGPIELLTDTEWLTQFEVNLFGVVRMTRAAMPLVDRAGGRFVHIGSISGRLSGPGLGPYAASKHALEAFNWSLRGELARNTAMTSSIIEPGEIDTAIWTKAEQTIKELEQRFVDSGTADRYGFLVDAQRSAFSGDTNRGVDADRVAQAVEHALTARRPKARYLVGTDAKTGALLARLPDRAVEGLLKLNARRMERAGSSIRTDEGR